MSMPSALDLNDGKFASRKLLLTIICIILLTAMTVLGILFPSMVALLPTFVGGLLGLVSLYFTGNVFNKFVVGKNLERLGVVDKSTVDNPDAKET